MPGKVQIMSKTTFSSKINFPGKPRGALHVYCDPQFWYFDFIIVPS